MSEVINSPNMGNFCVKCGALGEAIGIGSATGRIYYRCVPCASQWHGKNPAAVAAGILGGNARAAAMSSEQRHEQAVKAVTARWEKRRQSR